MTEKQLNVLRWRDFSVVMQSAMNALNPVTTIGAQFKDALDAHARMSRAEIAAPLGRGAASWSASTRST